MVVVVDEPQVDTCDVVETETSQGAVGKDTDDAGEKKTDHVVPVQPEGRVEETGDGEVESGEDSEKVLGSRCDESSVLVEESGELLDGSMISDGLQVATEPEKESHESAVPNNDSRSYITVDQITYNTPRARLKDCTVQDPTLVTIRRLADTDSDGYERVDGLVFRHRLDEWGEQYKQLCLSQEFRSQCLKLAHEKFGDRGRNKVTEDVKGLLH